LVVVYLPFNTTAKDWVKCARLRSCPSRSFHCRITRMSVPGTIDLSPRVKLK
jgi:hypothetical protein